MFAEVHWTCPHRAAPSLLRYTSVESCSTVQVSADASPVLRAPPRPAVRGLCPADREGDPASCRAAWRRGPNCPQTAAGGSLACLPWGRCVPLALRGWPRTTRGCGRAKCTPPDPGLAVSPRINVPWAPVLGRGPLAVAPAFSTTPSQRRLRKDDFSAAPSQRRPFKDALLKNAPSTCRAPDRLRRVLR